MNVCQVLWLFQKRLFNNSRISPKKYYSLHKILTLHKSYKTKYRMSEKPTSHQPHDITQTINKYPRFKIKSTYIIQAPTSRQVGEQAGNTRVRFRPEVTSSPLKGGKRGAVQSLARLARNAVTTRVAVTFPFYVTCFNVVGCLCEISCQNS